MAYMLPFSQQQRLQFIESMVFWEGGVQRQSVSEVFHVSPNHITKDFRLYKDRFPGNIEYDVSSRTYRPGRKFKPKLGAGKPEEYLALLLAYTQSKSLTMLPVLGTGAHTAVSLPEPWRQIDSDIIRTVIRALHSGCGIRALYHSMTDTKPLKRIIWPHALVHNGVRWHLRGYDDHRNTFRDFSLLRIVQAEGIQCLSPLSADKDKEWINFERVDVIPSPYLSEYQKQVVASEYGMRREDDGWIWSEQLRLCLIPYFLQRYRLDTPDSLHHKARIKLLEEERFSRYIFKG